MHPVTRLAKQESCDVRRLFLWTLLSTGGRVEGDSTSLSVPVQLPSSPVLSVSTSGSPLGEAWLNLYPGAFCFVC